MQKTLLWLELEQQAEEVGSSIWGGAALFDPVNEWVFDWPAFVHGYLISILLHSRICVGTIMSTKGGTYVKAYTVLSH